ncbi:hypothetical protein GCK72_006727 [Caenorhabditis remanei]|uniref:Serpentine receptor class gamma n=1 Tax=Caenorhabditis remanei TaxID=31234 RepID=A0A6A5HHE4_CAERE|nr:hypothetical protein GCK72_006727 [Caenorhabditis remanei]KAF1766769.1 hypothetical protein GCK72_006727 [Caenorhabditis remanei]
MDSIASSLIILADILFNRLFMFVTPLCPIVGPWFFSPSYVAKFVYILGNHARFSKSVAQIFLVLNRMSCVLSPVGYNHLWKNLLPVARVFIVIVPFACTWNLWISRTLIIPEFGGFALSYTRNVKWAALSLFQSIFILTALGFTVICTSVTLYRMAVLQERIKVAEKSLCFTSIFISFTFLLVAATQILWITCCASDLMYAIQFIAFDTFTVGSAVIVIVVNKHLRNSIFVVDWFCVWLVVDISEGGYPRHSGKGGSTKRSVVDWRDVSSPRSSSAPTDAFVGSPVVTDNDEFVDSVALVNSSFSVVSRLPPAGRCHDRSEPYANHDSTGDAHPPDAWCTPGYLAALDSAPRGLNDVLCAPATHCLCFEVLRCIVLLLRCVLTFGVYDVLLLLLPLLIRAKCELQTTGSSFLLDAWRTPWYLAVAPEKGPWAGCVMHTAVDLRMYTMPGLWMPAVEIRMTSSTCKRLDSSQRILQHDFLLHALVCSFETFSMSAPRTT